MQGLSRSISILDVGHGNGAVLVDDNGVVVIDAGPGSALLEFLRHEGIDRINVLLISHADKDHTEGIIALLTSKEVLIDHIRLNSDALKGSALWDDLLWELNEGHLAGRVDFDVSLTTKNTGEFDQGSVQVEILAPNLYVAAKGPGGIDRHGRTLTTNSASAVIRLVYNGSPIVLFPGDIDDVGLANLEDDLCRSGSDARAPIIVFPHHGGRPGSDDFVGFAKRICHMASPRTVVFSIGRGAYNTPRPEIVMAIRESVVDVRIACTQLSKHCSSDLPSLEPLHLSPKYARGRERKRCCAGTLVIDLTDTGASIRPLASDHLAFINTYAPSALCERPIGTRASSH